MARYKRVTIASKRQYEHRAVWEQAHNQKIPEGYVVHHIDGNSKNNDPSNLQLMKESDHIILHNKMRAEGIDPVDPNDPEVIKARFMRKRYHQQHIEEDRKRDKEYREKHKDRIRERQKQYAKDHPDKIKAQREKYASENRDKMREYGRKYYKENRDKLLAYSIKYNSEHKAQRAAYACRYQLANKDRIREVHKKYYGANIDVIHAKAAVYRDNHRALKRAMDNLRNAKKRGEPAEVIERLEAVLVKARENPSGK